MRVAIFIICLFICNQSLAQSPAARNKWVQIHRIISADYDSGKIDSKEWYRRTRVEAGSLGTSFQAWFVSQRMSDAASEQLKVKKGNLPTLMIPDDHKVTTENGNRYIRLLLINNTDTNLTIPRNDATVGGFTCYVLLNREWILLRGTPVVPCGNSAFSETIPTGSFATINLETADHGDGNIEIPFKVNFELADGSIESNIINVKLLRSQVDRLLEENEEFKRRAAIKAN